MKVKIDGVEHELVEPDHMTNKEIMSVEQETGVPVSEWQRMSMAVITGMVWATLKRDNPKLKFRDVEFSMADVIPDDDEADGEEEGKDDGQADS